MGVFRLSSKLEQGSAVIEFVIVIPVIVLLVWGALTIGIQLLDGMLLEYGVYEEARRGAVAESSSQLPVVRTVMAWSKGSLLPLLQVSGEGKDEDKDAVVEARFEQPWLKSLLFTNPIARIYQPDTNWLAQNLFELERARGTVQLSYLLPKENDEMYPKSIWRLLLEFIGARIGVKLATK